MSIFKRYFVPKLSPSQVYVPSEYIVAHGGKISLAEEATAYSIDTQLELGERTKGAWQAAFAVDESFHPGIVAVTTHRLLCCSCVANNLIVASLPFSQCIGMGDESGRILKVLPVHCEDVHVKVKASGEHIAQIREAILRGIEERPLQTDIDINPYVIQQSSEERREVQKIKAAHKGERRLSKSESAAYGKCPSCKGTVLVEKKGAIYCLKCGHEFTPDKK